jgi:hypothetical protein
MLTDDEAEEIRRGLESGMRGPVLIKWVRELLEDRDERVRLDRRRPSEAEDPKQPGQK